MPTLRSTLSRTLQLKTANPHAFLGILAFAALALIPAPIAQGPVSGAAMAQGWPAQCGRDGQRACRVWERIPSCQSGLKQRGFPEGVCVSRNPQPEVAPPSPSPLPQPNGAPRANDVDPVTIIRAAIRAYHIPHYSGRFTVPDRNYLACNKTDQAKDCREAGVWKEAGGFDLEYFYTADNGAQAGLYRDVASGAFILAFAGTDFKRVNDILADFSLTAGLPIISNQYQQIGREVRARMKTVGANFDTDLTVTGHSLGGYYAQVLAAKVRVPRVLTFSSPAAGNALARLPRATPEGRLEHIVREGDPVPLAGGRHYGRKTLTFATPFNPPRNVLKRAKYEASFNFAQHNKHSFLEHLKQRFAPYGHINFPSKRLSSDKRRFGLKSCARGAVSPLDLTLTMGLCTAATTFNFDRNGYLRNKRAVDFTQVCVAARGRGQPVTMSQCLGHPNQVWRHSGNQLKNRGTGDCLDFAQSGRHKNKVITWPCNKAVNQTWRFI